MNMLDTVTRLLKNEDCRGAKPLCRESEDVPQIRSLSPLPGRKGVRGIVERVFQHPVTRWRPVQEAHAHCDIPCGIYDPIAAKIAAQTVQKMVMRIQALEYPQGSSHEEHTAYRNSLGRYITVKEQHAELVKHEIDILWHDYFKPEHLEKYPSLHNDVWETTKLASTNKQTVDLDAAKNLVASVDKIAETFWASKGVTYGDPNAEVRFGS